MIRTRRLLAAAIGSCAMLVLAACGGGPGARSTAATGEPVAGGTAQILTLAEPRSLDPAALGNSGPITAPVGNALYGTLMTDTPTGEIRYSMAESFTTADGGRTFEMRLRPGLVFSDGTPLDAAAVKFNWDRVKDRATGSSSQYEASLIASTNTVDDRTVRLTMTAPLVNYPQMVLSTAMNWIGSPAALRAGQQAFDANPIGAGPFTLRTWTRNGPMELVKNARYWDSPRPYLDAVTFRAAADAAQRINTMVSGGADVAVESNWTNLAKATSAGLTTDVSPLNGGLHLALNARRAPFDDVRARQAVAAAIDSDAINISVYNGDGQVAPTLFDKHSPFYGDTPLRALDRDRAQRLFDELAAAGKPVSFTITSYPSTESRGIAESVQAQLSGFRNVQVRITIVDVAASASLRSTYDFDMLPSSAYFADPDPRLWTVFHSDSAQNMSAVRDPQLDAALQTGRTATSTGERKVAYDMVQQRLIELAPVVFVARTANAALAGENIGGVAQYGNGSLLPAELWVSRRS